MTPLEYLGWFGTSLYLGNYAYLAFVSRYSRPMYFTANAVAAISLVISSFAIASWQAVGINLFWAAISLWLLLGRGFRFVTADPRLLVFVTFGFWVIALAAVIVALPQSVSVLGWSSMFAFSASYLLFAADRLNVGMFHLWNAYAAVVLMPQLSLDSNWPVLLLEICWFLISVFAYINHRLRAPLVDEPDEPCLEAITKEA